jgi:predicted kinase
MPASSRPEAGTVHLVAGPTGAGKSTLAGRLAAAHGAVVFGIDDWMGRLYWPDMAPGADAAWAHERVARCIAQMRAVIAALVPLGVASVVDAGFTTRVERTEFAGWAAARGLAVRLHWIDLAPGARWARVEARNAAGGGATGFPVTREMFDYMEGLWEPPDAAEAAALHAVRITG